MRWEADEEAAFRLAVDHRSIDADLAGWPTVMPPRLPEFPVDALPTPIADWATATAHHTQTPVDLPALSALSVVASAALGGAVVDCGGWEEELGLYLLVAMPSGERKSTVLRAATRPLREIERNRAAAAAPHIREHRTRHDVLAARVRSLTKQAAAAAAAERLEAERDLFDATAELDLIGLLPVPRLLADDATPEALAELLARHGRIAILAAESALIDNLGGRYNDGMANLHLACAAYGGEATTVDRKGHEPEQLDRPLLTIGLVVQPHVLESLVNHSTARAQGLVARFAYALPETRLGRRQITTGRVPSEVTAGWERIVHRVATIADRTDTTLPTTSSVSSVSAATARLELSPAARKLLIQLQEGLEPRLAPGADLHPIADWVSRHHGRVARIAGLLHLSERSPTEPIAGPTMGAALRMGDYFLAHGIAALTGPDERVRGALRWLERHEEDAVTVRDIHRGPCGGRGPVQQAEALAQALEQLGALRSVPVAPSGQGRPKSPRFAINPRCAAGRRDPVCDVEIGGPAHSNGDHRSPTTAEEPAFVGGTQLWGPDS